MINLNDIYNYDEIYLYGARLVGSTVFYYLSKKFPDVFINGFIVTKKDEDSYLGKNVYTPEEIDNKNVLIIVATFRGYHKEILGNLEKLGFYNVIVVDYLTLDNMVLDVRTDIKLLGESNSEGYKDDILNIYMAKGETDKKLNEDINIDKWIIPIQVGSCFSNNNICQIKDNIGDNISYKNKNYCELTGLYWIWKNATSKYIGLCHYRRFFEINSNMINYMIENDIDVILPVPIICLNNARSHHKYYVREEEFLAMEDVLKEFYPFYYEASKEVFNDNLCYLYNMFIMKKEYIDEYCTWLFDVLDKIDKKINPDNSISSRYIGYLAEELNTIYFRYNSKRLNIRHAHVKMII